MVYKLLLAILVILVLVYFINNYRKQHKTINKVTTSKVLGDVVATGVGEKDIAALTDEWINQVTVKNSPEGVTNMFCPDGKLIGTVSQVKRTGLDIKKYFDIFAKKQGITVLDKKYNISRVAPGVFINTSFITWFWSGLNEPTVARMTFVFREKCLFQLHSSVLPEVNDELFDIRNLP
jgi:hypothetical protein